MQKYERPLDQELQVVVYGQRRALCAIVFGFHAGLNSELRVLFEILHFLQNITCRNCEYGQEYGIVRTTNVILFIFLIF